MNILKTKRIFFVVLTIFFVLGIKAQTDFRPGYIITLQGDTIKGLINYGGDATNAKGCTFKKEDNQNKVIYTPDQISSYRFIDGKYYVSSNSIKYKFQTPVFLEYVIKAAVSIYYCKDGENERYFTARDTLVMELDHYVDVDNFPKDDSKISKPSQKYKGQLKYLMIDQPSLFEKTNGTDCNAKSLISLTKEYQKLSCPSQECLLYEKKTYKDVKFKFGVFGSTGLSNLSSPPYAAGVSDYSVVKYLDFHTSLTYEIGASLNLYLNFIGENKYSVQLSPALNHVDYKSYMEYPLNSLIYSYKTNIGFTTLKIPMVFKYSLYSSTWPVIPFARFGMGFAIYLKQKGLYEYRSYADVNDNHGTYYSESLTTNISKPTCAYFIAGVGVDVKSGKKFVTVGANFEYGNGQLEGYRFDALLQIGYQF